MPWIGFVFLMGHMSLNHVTRHFVNTPDKIDVTGAFVKQRSGGYN